MKKKYIYILVEVARRELDSRLAIGIELAKQGYEVIIGEKNQILWSMFAGRYPPGVILDKCAQFAAHKNFKSLIRKGFVYTVLDEEGLLTNKEYFNKSRFSQKAEKYVTANFVTGKNLNKIILSDYPSAKNIVSGNPRYSMLHEEWKHWYEEEYNIIKKTYGKFVLIVSSFNPYPQAYLYAIPGMKEIDEYFKQKMEEYLSDNKGSGHSFVLRPHPSDQPYKYADIKIDDRFNIIPWIMASEYIVNAKCTTSLEAFIAAKPVYTWKYKISEKVYKLANIFANDIGDYGKIEPPSFRKKRSKILEGLLAHYDSAYTSINIIVETLGKLSFPVTPPKRIHSSIHKVMHLRNGIRFFFMGDNYNRILQKFTKDHIHYTVKKVTANNLQAEVNDKVVIIRNN